MKKIKKVVNITNLQRKQKINLRSVRYTAIKAIDALYCGNYVLEIIFCSPVYIRKLNKLYRSKDSSTDVLSFENGEFDGDILYIGDIYISPTVALKNSLIYQDFWHKENWIDEGRDISKRNKATGFNREINLLLIHGILHLFGYTHDEDHTLDISDREYDEDMKKMQKNIFDIVKIK